MPRTREFDTERALEKAMEVFWSKGYEAATIQNLVDGMGVQRGSLYAAFGDKHTLYVHTLEQYLKSIVAKHLNAMGDVHDGLPAIQRFFNDILQFSLSSEGDRGCLLTNSATELANSDEHVAGVLRRMTQQLEDQLYSALQYAQALGQIAPERDCEALAAYLLMTLNGFRVTAKLRREERYLRSLIGQILAGLSGNEQRHATHD